MRERAARLSGRATSRPFVPSSSSISQGYSAPPAYLASAGVVNVPYRAAGSFADMAQHSFNYGGSLFFDLYGNPIQQRDEEGAFGVPLQQQLDSQFMSPERGSYDQEYMQPFFHPALRDQENQHTDHSSSSSSAYFDPILPAGPYLPVTNDYHDPIPSSQIGDMHHQLHSQTVPLQRHDAGLSPSSYQGQQAGWQEHLPVGHGYRMNYEEKGKARLDDSTSAKAMEGHASEVQTARPVTSPGENTAIVYHVMADIVRDPAVLARMHEQYKNETYQAFPRELRLAAQDLLSKVRGVIPQTIQKRASKVMTWDMLCQTLSGDPRQVQQVIRAMSIKMNPSWASSIGPDEVQIVLMKVGRVLGLTDPILTFTWMAEHIIPATAGEAILRSSSDGEVFEMLSHWPIKVQRRSSNNPKARGK
jgi:hypothetical protein